jgi:hypothetical protein
MAEFLLAEVASEADRPFVVECARPARASRDEFTMISVVEMLLKNRARLNALLRDEAYTRELVPSLLAVAAVGFAVHGVVTTAILNGLYHTSSFWFPHLPAAYWNHPSAGNLVLSYTLGLIAANGICLPSFYFYGLLAGVRISILGVSAHALKGMAAGAVALIGLLPIYVAIALSAIVFPLGTYWIGYTVAIGLALPFIAGFAGAANLYEGFVGLADTMTGPRCASRQCFLRRLILAWVACATFVTPVVIYSLWHFLSDLTR